MFDIVGFVREKIFKRARLSQNLAGEELSEKQTTKLGYFLLFCMFGAILTSAHWTLSIIKHIPNSPTDIPYCMESIATALRITTQEDSAYQRYSPYDYSDCGNLVSLKNPKFNFQEEHDALEGPYKLIKGYRSTIHSLLGEKDASYNYEQARRLDYNTSLHEKGGNENSGLYDTQSIQENIKEERAQRSKIDTEVAGYHQKIATLRHENQSMLAALDLELKEANGAYQKAYMWYRFYIASLSFVFVGFVLYILYNIYLAQTRKNSPHSIIFSVATFAYGLIFLEIVFMLVWDLIPHTFLDFLSKFFMEFRPLLFLLQFIWPLLIVAIFGFLVYKIQKRLYSSENLLKRFLSDKKCPSCSNTVDLQKKFCSLCAHEIQVHCKYCSELTLKGMPYCSSCGGTQKEKNRVTQRQTNIFDRPLSSALSQIDISDYTGVRFDPHEGKSFVSRKESVIKLSVLMVEKLGKKEFSEGEFSPFLGQITEHIKDDSIQKAELNTTLGKVKSWSEFGGKIIFLKK